MFDNQMRSVKERVFVPVALPLAKLPPWWFSVIGLVLGVATAVALAQQAYILGFILWFFNRVFDALDGVIARISGQQSDFGGYLDILIDFVVYALIPIGLVLGRPSTTLYIILALLLAVYYVNAASWMYLSAILEKRNAGQVGKETTITMPPGIIGGTETIVLYGLFMLFPVWLVWLFSLMAVLVALTVGQRLWWAWRHL